MTYTASSNLKRVVKKRLGTGNKKDVDIILRTGAQEKANWRGTGRPAKMPSAAQQKQMATKAAARKAAIRGGKRSMQVGSITRRG